MFREILNTEDKEMLDSQTLRIQTIFNRADKIKILDPYSVWFLEIKMGKTNKRSKIDGALGSYLNS